MVSSSVYSPNILAFLNAPVTEWMYGLSPLSFHHRFSF